MPTINQLVRQGRKSVPKKSKNAALQHNSQKRGVSVSLTASRSPHTFLARATTSRSTPSSSSAAAVFATSPVFVITSSVAPTTPLR